MIKAPGLMEPSNEVIGIRPRKSWPWVKTGSSRKSKTLVCVGAAALVSHLDSNTPSCPRFLTAGKYHGHFKPQIWLTKSLLIHYGPQLIHLSFEQTILLGYQLRRI